MRKEEEKTNRGDIISDSVEREPRVTVLFGSGADTNFDINLKSGDEFRNVLSHYVK